MAKDSITGKERLLSGADPQLDSLGERVYLDIDLANIGPSVAYGTDVRGLDIKVAGTFPSVAGIQSGGLEGLRVDATLWGTDGRRAVGIYAVLTVTGEAKCLTGFFCGAEIEVINTGTLATATDCAYAILQLRDTADAGVGRNPLQSFIRLRQGGNRAALNLFNFANEDSTTAAADHDTRMVVAVGNAAVANGCAIRCVINSVPMWILASLTPPA